MLNFLAVNQNVELYLNILTLGKGSRRWCLLLQDRTPVEAQFELPPNENPTGGGISSEDKEVILEDTVAVNFQVH